MFLTCGRWWIPQVPAAPNAPSAPSVPDAPSLSAAGGYVSDTLEAYADDVDSIVIDWAAGVVNARRVPDSETAGKVIVTERVSGSARAAKLEAGLDDKTLRVSYGMQPWFFFGCSLSTKTLDIAIPESVASRLKAFSLDAASGSYEISGLDCDAFNLNLASGNVRIFDTSSRNTAFGVASGKVQMEGALTDKFELSLASGEVAIKSSAEITLSSANIDVMSGKVSLELPETPGFTVNLDKLSGSFNCDLPHTQRDDTYIVDDGSGKMKIHIASGDVSLIAN